MAIHEVFRWRQVVFQNHVEHNLVKGHDSGRIDL